MQSTSAADSRAEHPMSERIALCRSGDLLDGDLAVPFDLLYAGQTCRAFAIRHAGQAHAYLNRCAHVSMELDMMPNRFFDRSGTMLICSSHGAVYSPADGRCLGGPCRGGLIGIVLTESDGFVYWHTAFNLRPLEF